MFIESPTSSPTLQEVLSYSLEYVLEGKAAGAFHSQCLAEYLVPVCADAQELDAMFVKAMLSPLGVKGLAELALCGVASRYCQRGLARDRYPRPHSAHYAGQIACIVGLWIKVSD